LHLRQASAARAKPAPSEGIVAAGVENDEVEPRASALHLAEHKRGIEHLKIDICLARRVGVDQHEIVGAADLHTVPCVIEKTDIGTLQFRAEVLHRLVKSRFVEVELRPSADQREAQAL